MKNHLFINNLFSIEQESNYSRTQNLSSFEIKNKSIFLGVYKVLIKKLGRTKKKI